MAGVVMTGVAICMTGTVMTGAVMAGAAAKAARSVTNKFKSAETLLVRNVCKLIV